MSDILIDPSTGDIKIEGNKVVVTKDIPTLVRQRLKHRLDTSKGEWFLDSNYGVPYFQSIFVKPFDKSFVDNILRRVILDTEDVVSISSYSSSLDHANRVFSITFSVVDSTNSTINIDNLQVA